MQLLSLASILEKTSDKNNRKQLEFHNTIRGLLNFFRYLLLARLPRA